MFVCILELLPVLQNCSSKDKKIISFKRFFHDGGLCSLSFEVGCWITVEIWCPDLLKIFLFIKRKTCNWCFWRSVAVVSERMKGSI